MAENDGERPLSDAQLRALEAAFARVGDLGDDRERDIRVLARPGATDAETAWRLEQLRALDFNAYSDAGGPDRLLEILRKANGPAPAPEDEESVLGVADAPAEVSAAAKMPLPDTEVEFVPEPTEHELDPADEDGDDIEEAPEDPDADESKALKEPAAPVEQPKQPPEPPTIASWRKPAPRDPRGEAVVQMLFSFVTGDWANAYLEARRREAAQAQAAESVLSAREKAR